MVDDTLIMWSVGQIADRDKVSKAAVSKAVKKLTEELPETPVERDGHGRVMRVSLAHYDHYRQRYVNPAKAKAEIRDGSSATPELPLRDPADSFDEARRQSEWLKVGREKIRHQEECGQLIRKDKLETAVKTVAAAIQADIRRLANRADDVALAVSKEGVHGVRVLLRQIALEIGNSVADHLGEIADAAPVLDELIDEDAA
jgi:hypothetical protein